MDMGTVGTIAGALVIVFLGIVVYSPFILSGRISRRRGE